MPKKILFEWELPDALVDAVAPDASQLADTIKQAAVLDWCAQTGYQCATGQSSWGCPIVNSLS